MRLRQPDRRHIDLHRALLLVVLAVIVVGVLGLLAGQLLVAEAKAQSAPVSPSPSIPPQIERGDVIIPHGARFDAFRSRPPGREAAAVAPGGAGEPRGQVDPGEAARRSAVLGAPDAAAARSGVLVLEPRELPSSAPPSARLEAGAGEAAGGGPRIFTSPELRELAEVTAAAIAQRAATGMRRAGAFADALPQLDDRARAAGFVLLEEELAALDDALLELRFAARGLRSPRLDGPVEAVDSAWAAVDAARTNLAVAASDRARVEALREVEGALASLQEQAAAVGTLGPKTIELP